MYTQAKDTHFSLSVSSIGNILLCILGIFFFFNYHYVFVLLVVLPTICFGLFHIRVGDGTPLQYSCLENPMDGGAW